MVLFTVFSWSLNTIWILGQMLRLFTIWVLPTIPGFWVLPIIPGFSPNVSSRKIMPWRKTPDFDSGYPNVNPSLWYSHCVPLNSLNFSFHMPKADKSAYGPPVNPDVPFAPDNEHHSFALSVWLCGPLHVYPFNICARGLTIPVSHHVAGQLN